ncbi:tail fiber domain-containing protein [Mucilaginibacter lacusdianchii]|uniref:tail fiber domain-containing protein n=1 Tax=Mucilaginibacter lacusdianchii TaxID=2684211 RepID=UPI00131CAE9B|nr:tail fiber domain-containing protein [Mucilaginibacter sp. JXJ CY 39]
MKSFKTVVLAAILSAFTTIAFGQTKLDDKQAKSNVTPINGALQSVNRLQPVTYNYNSEQLKGINLPQGMQYGFVADDVQAVLPGLVKTESKLVPSGKNAYRSVNMKTVDMQSLIPVLLGAIKEQQQQIEELRAEVQSLKQNRTSTSSTGE